MRLLRSRGSLISYFLKTVKGFVSFICSRYCKYGIS